MTREIPLSRGLVALVDDADYERIVAAGPWHVLPGLRTHYAKHSVRRNVAGKRAILMHALLTGWPMTDHINGDGLDNRRVNLRPATPTQNGANQGRRSSSTSPYKGVSLCQPGRWRAHICCQRVRIHLGYFTTSDAAARAYDAAAFEAWGPYARLNFPRVEVST